MKQPLVLTNAQIYSLDASNSVHRSVAVSGTRIVALDDACNKLIEAGAETIDLDGRAVLPGFIDAHTHWEVTAHIRRIWIDATLETPERVVEILRDEVRRRPRGEWIVISSGFIQPLPSKALLDEIAPHHPVIIRRTMHTQMANSLAFELSGITPARQPRTAQSRLHVGEDGNFTGFVEDAFDQFAVTKPNDSCLEDAMIDVASELFIANGITTIHDMPASSRGTHLLQRMHREGKLPLRVRMYPILPPIHSSGPDLPYYIETATESGFGDDMLRFGGLKFFVDGHENGIATEHRMDTSTPRSKRPLLGKTYEQLVMTITDAMRSNIQLRMHAWGDYAQREVIDATNAALRSVGPLDHRTRVEHMLNNGYPSIPLEEVRDSGLVPVPQASFMFNDNPDSKVKKYPFREAIDKELVFANSSDCTGSQPTLVNPWAGIAAMLARTNRDGVPMAPEQRVTLTEALRSYTGGSAFAGFEEHEKGSIEVGKLADFVILAQDPYSVPVQDLAEMTTDATIIGGEIKYLREGAVLSRGAEFH